MSPEQFVYWLQGYAELNGGPPTPEQWKSIQDHLNTVFNKVTPKTPIGEQKLCAGGTSFELPDFLKQGSGSISIPPPDHSKTIMVC